jgi:hypothetical protein
MLVGLLFLALPIAIIGSKVTVAYEELSARTKAQKEELKKLSLKKRVSLIGGVLSADTQADLDTHQSQGQGRSYAAPMDANTVDELRGILGEMDALQKQHSDLRARIAKIMPPPQTNTNTRAIK